MILIFKVISLGLIPSIRIWNPTHYPQKSDMSMSTCLTLDYSPSWNRLPAYYLAASSQSVKLTVSHQVVRSNAISNMVWIYLNNIDKYVLNIPLSRRTQSCMDNHLVVFLSTDLYFGRLSRDPCGTIGTVRTLVRTTAKESGLLIDQAQP